MSLDLSFYAIRRQEVGDFNITHNLNGMADAAGIYKCLWRPEENGIKTAAEMIPLLEAGLASLKAEPEKYLPLEPANKWGTYPGFVEFVDGVLACCRENPDAEVVAGR